LGREGTMEEKGKAHNNTEGEKEEKQRNNKKI